jgi:hypothetical protein
MCFISQSCRMAKLACTVRGWNQILGRNGRLEDIYLMRTMLRQRHLAVRSGETQQPCSDAKRPTGFDSANPRLFRRRCDEPSGLPVIRSLHPPTEFSFASSTRRRCLSDCRVERLGFWRGSDTQPVMVKYGGFLLFISNVDI